MTKNWYIVHAYSNFEHKVADAILEQAKLKKLEDKIERIEVPTEKIIEVKRGKRYEGERKLFPGYVLAYVEMDDDVYRLIRDVPKVTGFLGPDNKPSPVSNDEAERILSLMQEGAKTSRTTISFEIGEQVRVADGPFASFNGFVEAVDEEKEKLKVAVSIFGRQTPVELEFGQVEKM